MVFTIFLSILPEDSAFDIVRRAFDRCSKDKCTLIAFICSIWNRRNKWIWERVNMSAFGIKAVALNLLGEWKKAQEQQVESGTSAGTSIAIKK